MPHKPKPKGSRRGPQQAKGQTGTGRATPTPVSQGDPESEMMGESATWNAARRTAANTAKRAAEASRRAAAATPRIVVHAMSILEQQVAAGIGAAKRIEQRVLDVPALRAEDPNAVVWRFRRDAHEAVDILIDVVAAAADAASKQATRVVGVTAHRAGRPSTIADVRFPSVRASAPVAPGDVVEISVSLENPSEQSVDEFSLHSSELVTASGARIPPECITFEPALLTLEPHGSEAVTVRVRVPKDAAPGEYEGLVHARRLEQLHAVLTVHVK